MWHTDSSFKRVPATASLLSGREVPPTGGETEFATERVAYADLSAALRKRIDPLVAIHDFAYNRSLIDPKLMTEEQKRETPPVPQAVVRANPANGRKNFYAGAHASHIRGMPFEEGRTLLKELTTIATQPQYTLRHPWRDNDLVIWTTAAASTAAAPGIKPATAGLCIAPRSRGSGRPRSKNRSGYNPFLLS